MNATRHQSPPPPALGKTAVGSTGARAAWWVLGAPALALASTFALVVAGAPGDWIGAIWLVAVLWTIAATLVKSLWAGVRHGDWSAFGCDALPRCQPLAGDDDDHDFATRSGSYAYLRIRDEHEAMTREGDRYLEDHDRSHSPG